MMLISFEKIFLFNLSFKNQVPLPNDEADIARANGPNKLLATRCSKIIGIFSLSIFLGFNFLMARSAACFLTSSVVSDR